MRGQLEHPKQYILFPVPSSLPWSVPMETVIVTAILMPTLSVAVNNLAILVATCKLFLAIGFGAFEIQNISVVRTKEKNEARAAIQL